MSMNKTLAVIALLTAMVSMVYGEAPELRNVMPNSWRKINRLSANEEATFIETNREIIDKMLESFYKSGSFVRDNINRQNLNNNDVRVYAEQAGLDTFYRIIIAESKPTNYDGWKEAFLQGLIYELNGRKTVLVMNEYNKIMAARTDGRSYTSIDIVRGKDRAKGITISYVYAPHVDSDIEKTYSSRKGQFYGETMLLYFRMEDFTVEMKFPSGGGSGLYSPGIPSITVHASDCLIDRNIPLRYGIQSAFDGDPATSYVENIEDDLMEIDFSYGLKTQEYITRIGLIRVCL